MSISKMSICTSLISSQGLIKNVFILKKYFSKTQGIPYAKEKPPKWRFFFC